MKSWVGDGHLVFLFDPRVENQIFIPFTFTFIFSLSSPYSWHTFAIQVITRRRRMDETREWDEREGTRETSSSVVSLVCYHQLHPSLNFLFCQNLSIFCIDSPLSFATGKSMSLVLQRCIIIEWKRDKEFLLSSHHERLYSLLLYWA